MGLKQERKPGIAGLARSDRILKLHAVLRNVPREFVNTLSHVTIAW